MAKLPSGYRIKDGKVIKSQGKSDTLTKIKQRKSKKQRVVSPAKAGRTT